MFESDNTISPADAAQEGVSRFRLKRHSEPVPVDPPAVAAKFYTEDRAGFRHYYSDHTQKQEIMRATATSVRSRLSDRETITAMLDVAQARGWQKVHLRGSAEFKAEAWVQAQLRGIQVTGYTARAPNVQEVERRRQAMGAATPAQPVAKAPAAAAKRTGGPDLSIPPVPVAASASKPTAKAPALARSNTVQKAAGAWDATAAKGAKARAASPQTATAAQKPKTAMTA